MWFKFHIASCKESFHLIPNMIHTCSVVHYTMRERSCFVSKLAPRGHQRSNLWWPNILICLLYNFIHVYQFVAYIQNCTIDWLNCPTTRLPIKCIVRNDCTNCRSIFAHCVCINIFSVCVCVCVRCVCALCVCVVCVRCVCALCVCLCWNETIEEK